MRPAQPQTETTEPETTRIVGVRLPVSLHEQAQQKARTRFQSFSAEVRRLLVDYVKDES